MMETVRTGRVWKFGDHISTDFMMPGHRVLANPDLTVEEAAKFCMEANRPGWAEDEVQPGDILVAGINFGCGSSRNGSQSLKALNIAVVLAESVSRIHLRNAVNSGLPTLVAPGINDFVEEGQRLEVNIVTGEVKNLDTGATLQAEAWEEGTPPYEILMAGGLDAFMKTKLKERGRISA
ncbi:MAG: 3-isopropylmalate dehydratase [Rhodospirillaceae bacterium]|jgi:3-isopropylmalate/(R)-2-methylmalate dehydratase small subunit|nr:3-isopropylmalate dehydratase [Rhodospirillaceae bacterium]MBT3782239.1 3-isopropylmalate dehydratase [Rhodospirillaceae bacterium]MBT6679327.1 3-isopropylmalate dehydratase [Rhodospirillaceae bacterium]MBT7157231.1 3-isopropylmalate dehydratase [Rhodospirillaceae bacterium]MBT7636208.1 3-isopropylmalate dehydratase [Rhodospirillaceae bacterium]